MVEVLGLLLVLLLLLLLIHTGTSASTGTWIGNRSNTDTVSTTTTGTAATICIYVCVYVGVCVGVCIGGISAHLWAQHIHVPVLHRLHHQLFLRLKLVHPSHPRQSADTEDMFLHSQTHTDRLMLDSYHNVPVSSGVLCSELRNTARAAFSDVTMNIFTCFSLSWLWLRFLCFWFYFGGKHIFMTEQQQKHSCLLRKLFPKKPQKTVPRPQVGSPPVWLCWNHSVNTGAQVRRQIWPDLVTGSELKCAFHAVVFFVLSSEPVPDSNLQPGDQTLLWSRHGDGGLPEHVASDGGDRFPELSERGAPSLVSLHSHNHLPGWVHPENHRLQKTLLQGRLEHPRLRGHRNVYDRYVFIRWCHCSMMMSSLLLIATFIHLLRLFWDSDFLVLSAPPPASSRSVPQWPPWEVLFASIFYVMPLILPTGTSWSYPLHHSLCQRDAEAAYSLCDVTSCPRQHWFCASPYHGHLLNLWHV